MAHARPAAALLALQEERLRKQLSEGKFANAAAMMRMAVNLALAANASALG